MKSMNREQLRTLLQAVPQERSRLMLLVGFLHALRVSEIITLKGKNLRDGYLVVQRLKKSKKTIQPFIYHEDPVFNEGPMLEKLAKTVKPDELLFPMTRDGVLKLMKRAGDRSGIPEHLCHPHVLKHSIAMMMIKQKPIKEVQVYLGHVEGKNTLRYLEATEEEAARGIASLI